MPTLDQALITNPVFFASLSWTESILGIKVVCKWIGHIEASFK